MSSSILVCGRCEKRYKYKASFEKHIKQCSAPLTKCSFVPFDFADEYFSEEDIATQESTSNIPLWVSKLNDFARKEIICNKNKNNFLVLHININSLFTKTNHIFDILFLVKPDILALNETKLGHDTPDSAINPANPANYCLFRRDRSKGGGGVAIYLKKGLKVLYSYISLDFELIHLKLLISKRILHFISCYKPPSDKNEVFLEYLDTILCSININEDIIISGDLNMDLLTDKGQALREFCVNHSLANRVEKPTRVADRCRGDTFSNSSTLIDVLLERKRTISETTVIDFPFSDHKFVAARLKFAKSQVKHDGKLSRKLNKSALDSIANTLKSLDLSILESIDNLNARWQSFKSIILNIVDTFAPLQRPKLRKHHCVPWFDEELVALRKAVEIAYDISQSTNSLADKDAFKSARATYQSSFRRKRTEYYADKTASKFKSSRNFWQFYSDTMRLKKSDQLSNAPKAIIADGVTLTEPADIAIEFNEFFTGLGEPSKVSLNEATSFINKTFALNSKLTPSTNIHGAFKFRATTQSIVEKLLAKLEESSSPGVSGIPVVILKTCASELAPFLCRLFNDCISQCYFPDEFKIGLVTPLFKNKGSPHEMNNYRGITVLPPISKVFEKVMAEQLRLYFCINNLFFDGQHGFREAHSCESALHEIISACLNNMDKDLINLLLFIDFKKAFDLISPDLLMIKLLNYGFTNEALSLISNYFSNRRQSVKIGFLKSSERNITLGVPQGSVIGPLLFLIYINDLPYYLSNTVCKLFADDTTLVFAGSDCVDAVNELKKTVMPLLEWCENNYMYVNWSKTYAMFVTTKRTTRPDTIRIDSGTIEIVDTFKLLGVTIDSRLNFLNHVHTISKSIFSKLYAIKRLFFLSFNVKMLFFKLLFFLILTTVYLL